MPYGGCILLILWSVGRLVGQSVGWLVGHWSLLIGQSVHNKGCRALGGFSPKGLICYLTTIKENTHGRPK